MNKYSNEYNRLVETIAHYFIDHSVDATARQAQLKGILEELSSLGLMLCGGATLSLFTRSPVNDLDFYMKWPDKRGECELFFLRHFQLSYSSTNAITYTRQSSGTSRKVWRAQLITRFVGDPIYIFNTFDFTITQSLFDFSTKQFEFGERFFPDVAAKRLVFVGNSRYPICAMYRTKKYQARGYTLPGSTIMHIALNIVRLKIANYGQLKEQLMGIDTMYLQGLLGGPGYADELPVDYGAFLADVFSRVDGEEYDRTDYE